MRKVRVNIGFELQTDESVDNLNQDALEVRALLDDKICPRNDFTRRGT